LSTTVEVVLRTSRNTGCAFCQGKQVDRKASLGALYPTVAAEWDHSANGDLTPDHVLPGSAKHAW
jgi:hypothetical protein